MTEETIVQPEIFNPQVSESELVVVQQKTASEFKILEVVENFEFKFVKARIQFFPYSGAGDIRDVTVWRDEEYFAVVETWRNEDLVARIKEVLAA